MAALQVFVKQSFVVDVVSVFCREVDLAEACGLFDDGLVKHGVVESGWMFGCECVFCGQAVGVVNFLCECNGYISVVVAMVVPPSDGQFTFGDDVEE